MEIIKLLSAVMEDAGAVRKSERNTHQNFNFRGIDAVVNAVSPALRKHGVVVLPTINSCVYETVVVGQNKTSMGHVQVNVTYTFYAPDGSNISATVNAESMDSGDKATAKAMSVAFRTALLQTLCLPTDDADPDAFTYERTTVKDVVAKQIAAKAATQEKAAPAPAATMAAKPAARTAKLGSAANKASENQIKMMNTVVAQIDGDDKLLVELTGKAALADLSSAEASKVIEQLLAIKRGEASISYDANGKMKVEVTK
ncbi:Essential recombination function protein [uncultured Caudovirales phage]|uniref:Essential recombination function protein n=1 Tax=uncultured Caudovirales phage TaxID=2100421 RepID=A0A6J5NAA3_9CAUD|nr:Essential recombination function protein [uncultured Caudovirales phage]